MSSHDAYVRFDGVDARVDQASQRGWSKLLGFRHALYQPGAGTAAMAGDSGPGRAEHGDFVVLKNIDEASPRLALICCNGFRLPGVTVAIHDSADYQLKYMEYRMTDVLVRGISTSLSEANVQLVREEVSLRYRRIVWGFTLNEANVARGEVRTYWDLQGNTGG